MLLSENRFTKLLNSNLKNKITFEVCLLVTVITASLGFFALSFFQDQIKENLAEQQLVLVSSIASNLDDNLTATENELAVLSKNITANTLQDPERAQKFLDGETEHKSTFDNGIMVFSREGKLIAESPSLPGRRGKNFNQPDQFKIMMASAKARISRPHFSVKSHRHPVVTLTVPIFDAAGEIIGALAGSIDLTSHNFLGKIAHTPVGKHGYLYLFDTDRTMIMHPDPQRLLVKDVPHGSNRGFDKAVVGFDGTMETVNSKGLPVLATFKHLTQADWILAANYPQAEAYAPIARARVLLCTFLIVAIPLLVVCVWGYIWRQTAPLLRFTDHIRSLSIKQGTERFFGYGNADEIGILAEAFNGMIEALDSERGALRRSEALLTKAQHLAKVGNWQLNVQSGMITWSEEMYVITGLGRDDFAGTQEAFLDLVHPEERKKVQRAFLAAVHDGETFAIEHRFVQPSGKLVTVQSIAEVSFDQQGHALRTFGTVQDITAKKEAEIELFLATEELRESEERFRQFSEHCKEVFFVVASDMSQIMYVNKAYETIWQLSCQSLYQHPLSFTDIIHEEDRARIFNALEQLTRGEAFDQTYRIVRSDRTLCWIHARTYPIYAETGEVYRYAGIAEDVTQQKLVDERIRKLQQAVEQSPVSIVITDCKGIIEYVNPRFTELTGYLHAEAVGQNPRLLKSGAMWADIYRDLWETITAGKEWHGELLNKKKNGELFWELAHLSPIRNTAGEITHFLGVKEDITTRKAMEEELKQATLLAEEANSMKSEFLANMSHEIRTPMNGVIGMTELLVATDLDEEQYGYVQAVKSSAESLLSVINEILDFSKIEAGKLDLDCIDFNLHSSLESFLRPLVLHAAEKGLELALRINADVPDALVGDPGRLRQVIVNLVSNAIKFTEKGEVVLNVNAEPSSPAEKCLRFSVTDTGIGIAAAKLEHIFDPFSQADGSTTRKFGGTGLGLTISKRLVEMMGGQILVESATGAGSNFNFTAYFGLSRGMPVVPVPKEPIYLQGLKVLVVDDNGTSRQILQELLSNLQMRPLLADSGKAALPMIAAARQSADPFRLLLLDVNMPDMDGFELAAHIKERPQDGAALVMMFSSVSQRRGDAARCRELGVKSILTKPFGQPSLLGAILTAVGGSVSEAAKTPPATVDSEHAGWKPLRVLLAEDNPINRRIVVGMMATQGHAVTVAANGKEAVEAFLEAGTDYFDLVLMDVQMPEMGGFEATALIRNQEKKSGLHVPIIALTAHALDGYREACLKAGMDGYLAKPIKTADLLASIAQVLKTQVQQRFARRAKEGAFGHDEALARMGDDRDLYRESVEIFEEHLPHMLREIRDAIAAGDPLRLSSCAHTLKGSISYLGAPGAFELALKLEMMGETEEMTGAKEGLEALEAEIALIRKSMALFVEAI